MRRQSDAPAWRRTVRRRPRHTGANGRYRRFTVPNGRLRGLKRPFGTVNPGFRVFEPVNGDRSDAVRKIRPGADAWGNGFCREATIRGKTIGGEAFDGGSQSIDVGGVKNRRMAVGGIGGRFRVRFRSWIGCLGMGLRSGSGGSCASDAVRCVRAVWPCDAEPCFSGLVVQDCATAVRCWAGRAPSMVYCRVPCTRAEV